jgi:cell division septum initiation protein DivIVA
MIGILYNTFKKFMENAYDPGSEAMTQDNDRPLLQEQQSLHSYEPLQIDLPPPAFTNEIGGYTRSSVNAYISQISDMMIEMLGRSERERKADCERADKNELVLLQFAMSAAELIDYYDAKMTKSLEKLNELAEYKRKSTLALERECARKTVNVQRLHTLTIYERRLTAELESECAAAQQQKQMLTAWVRDLRMILRESAAQGIADWLAQLSAEVTEAVNPPPPTEEKI